MLLQGNSCTTWACNGGKAGLISTSLRVSECSNLVLPF